MRYRLSLATLAGLLFLSAFAVSLGILGPTVTSIRARHLLRRQYGVSTPDEFTQLTGLTLKETSSIDFTTLTSSICSFNLVSLALASYLGGRLKHRITRPVAVALLFMFLLGFVSGVQVARAATPTYTIEPAGLLPKAYDYIIYESGGTYYLINGTTSTATSGTDDDTIIQAALNQSKSVIIKAGSYLATVTVKGGRLVIEKGATGVTYSIQAGATCVVEDWNDGETKYYSAGTLTLRLDHASGAVYAGEYHLDGDNVTEVLQYPYQPASYIIFKSGSTIYAKSGSTGEIDYSGTDAATVIQNAINALTSGRTWKERVILKGDFTINSSINLTSYTILDFREAKLTLGNSVNAPLIKATSKTDIEIWIGQINGNKANNIAQAGRSAINLALCNRVKILGGYIYNPIDNGIRLEGCTDVDVIGVHVYNASANSFYTILDLPSGTISERINFVACISIDPNDDGFTFDPGTKFTFAIACEAKGGNVGFAMYSDGVYPVEYNGFVACRVQVTKMEAITLENAHYNVIKGNTIQNVGQGYASASPGRFNAINLLATSNFNEIIGNTIYGAPEHGILVSGHGNTIIGNRITDIATRTANTYDGISITGNEAVVIGNNIEGRPTTKGRYGIYVNGDSALITFNEVLYNWASAGVSATGFYNKIKFNRGYETENSGSAVNSTSTTFVITHGLADTPTFVSASFNTTAIDAWTWTATSTTLTITVTPALTSPATVYWKAEVS